MYTLEYPKIEIKYSGSEGSEMVVLDAQIRECEEIRNKILSELAEIDASIGDYMDDLFSAAGHMAEFAEKSAGNVSQRRLESGRINAYDTANLVAAGVSAGAALVTGTFALASGAVKAIKARKEHNKKMDELMAKKVLVADEKLPYVRDVYEKLKSGPLVRIEKIYSSFFDSSVSGEKDIIGGQVTMFRKSFGMALKTRALAESFVYIINEMEAWKLGKHDSDYSQKDVSSLFYDEVALWPKKLNAQNWYELSKTAYESKATSIRVPLAFAFSDPVMLSQYVKIGLPNECELFSSELEPGASYVIEGEIKTTVNENGKWHTIGEIQVLDTIAGSLIKENEYYKGCNTIAEKDYVFPDKPKGFGLADALLVLLAIIVVIGYVWLDITLLKWWILKWWIFRILFLLIPFVFVAWKHNDYSFSDWEDFFDSLKDSFGDVLDWFIDCLPCSKRNNQYLEEIKHTKRIISHGKRNLFESVIKL